MAKYKLKNRALQSHLDAISGGDFSYRIKEYGIHFDEGGYTQIFFGNKTAKLWEPLSFSAILHKNEFEDFQEYNPDGWNWWPKVEPPKHVNMRVELYGKDEALDTPEPRLGREYFKGFGFWDGDRWYVYGIRVLDGSKVRFRPWE